MGAFRRLVTAEDLQRLERRDGRLELVAGRLVVREFAGARQGAIANELAYRLTRHVKPAGLGHVYPSGTGFQLASDPDTVRAPDTAFVSRERQAGIEPVGYMSVAPDLVVEVLSASDKPGSVLAKVADWLSAGTRLVWVLDPDRRVARVYRDDGTVSLLHGSDALRGEAVLPGFSCPLSSLWPGT